MEEKRKKDSRTEDSTNAKRKENFRFTWGGKCLYPTIQATRFNTPVYSVVLSVDTSVVGIST